MKIQLYSIVIALFFISCNKKIESDTIITGTPIEIEVIRFDKVFFETAPENLNKVKKEFPFFFPQGNDDSVWLNKMQDPLWRELYGEVQKKYSDIEPVKSEFETLFKNNTHVQLTILGKIDKKSLYAQMAAHDILCVPSRVESLGIINIEGLSTGISVVSTREGGIPEVLNYGENGWLAEPENAESLADALKNCIEADPSVRKQKSINGRRFIVQNFNIKELVAQFLDICENKK